MALFGTLKKWWEQITPQNEEALRQGQRGIDAANQRIAALGNRSKGVLGNAQTRQQFVQQNQPTPFKLPEVAAASFKQGLGETGTGISLGSLRLGTSIGQGVSGLADLAGKSTGTSRFSKGLDSFAKQLDETAKNEGVNGIYRGTQIIGEPVSFVAGGAALKAFGNIPRIAKATQVIGKPIQPVVKNLDKGVKTLEAANKTGRIAGTAIRAAVRPSNVANMAVDTGYTLGQEASKGRDISKGDVALAVGTSGALGVGLPVLAKSLEPGAQAASRVAKASTPDAAVGRRLSADNIAYGEVERNARTKAQQIARFNQEGRNVPAYLKKGYDDDLATLAEMRRQGKSKGSINPDYSDDAIRPKNTSTNNIASNKDRVDSPSSANIDSSLPEIVPPKSFLDSLKQEAKARREAQGKWEMKFREKAERLSEPERAKLREKMLKDAEKDLSRFRSEEAIDADIKNFTKNEVPEKATSNEVKRIVSESFSKNDYDSKNVGYFVDLTPENIKSVKPLKGIEQYGDTMYVDTTAGISEVKIQDWSDSGQGFRVSNGNGNEIARFNTREEAVEFARKALTIENEAARQGKRVILSGSRTEPRNQATAPKTDPLDALKQEATYYHGTTKDFNPTDIQTKNGVIWLNSDKNMVLNGKHIADRSKAKALEYGLDKNSKLLDLNKPIPKEIIDEYIAVINKNGRIPKDAIERIERDFNKPENLDMLVGQGIGDQMGGVLRKYGYDGIIRNDSAGGRSVGLMNKNRITAKSDPLSQLKAEARKYKSAEEFVASKGEPVFHGTKSDFTEFDNAKMGSQTDSGMYGKGFYFTPNTKAAKHYAGNKGKVKEVYLDMKNPYVINSAIDIPDIKVDGYNTNEYSEKFTKYLKDQGYDGVIDNLGVADNQRVVFDASQIKTKQQLTDLYNQATQPKGVILSGTSKNPNAPQTAKVMIKQPGKAMRVEQRQINTKGSTPEEIGRALGMSDEDMARAAKETSDPKGLPNGLENSGKANILKDFNDKEKYGIKDIQAEATNTFDDVFKKHLDYEELDDAALNKSNRTGAIKIARDKVGEYNPLRGTHNKVADKVEDLADGGRIARGVKRVAQYLNKNAGQDPAIVEAAKRYGGDSTYTDSALLQVGTKAYKLLPDANSRARVHAVLDPEGTNAGIKFDDLNPDQQKAADILRDLGDAINDSSYRAGFISKKKWESNRGGRYIARLYKEVATADDVADLMDLPDKKGLFMGMYKSRQEMNDALRDRLIKDPIKLAVIRARQVRQNEALAQYMQTAESKGYVSSQPRDGYIKISGDNRMGNWSGKHVRQDVYENVEGFKSTMQFGNAVNNLLDVYDGWMPRRVRKKMLTIYNPVVRLGNVTSNYFFAFLNGVNPVTFDKNKLWAKEAIKGNDPVYLAAQKAGLVRNHTITSDKNLFNKDKDFLSDLERSGQSGLEKAKGSPGAADRKLTERYGMTDDIAKLSAVKSHVDRGFSVNEAIQKASRGFQDYSRVGHLYDMGAKSPIFGSAFIRFQGDLYMNILKNAAVDHPLRLGSLVGGIWALGEGLSKLSGETAEDKKTREDRAGAPKIPFTNISTEFQTPFGAVDAARFTPLYMRQDIDGNSFTDNLSRLSPFNIPGGTSKEEVVKKMATDPLIGPALSMIGDVDWKGKSVKDPEGYRDGKPLFPDDPLTKGEEWRNRAQYGVRSYAPYPMNELGDILAFNRGDSETEQVEPGGKGSVDNTGKDFLSREGYNTDGTRRTVGQGLARLLGVRAQQFGTVEAQAKREQNAMFEHFDNVDSWKNTLDSTTRTQFEARHKSTRTRSGIASEFTDDPFWKYKNASELLQNPNLFDAEKNYAEIQNKYDGKPIDPIFNLPEDQRKQVLLKKLKMPGAKDEGLNTLYDQDWYADFRKEQDKYYNDKDAYLQRRAEEAEKDGNKSLAASFRKSLEEKDNEYPEPPAQLQKHIDYYFDLPKGTGARSAFINGNPAIWKQITDQWDKQDKWNAEERKKLGLPAIPEADDKYAYGGKRGKKGGRKGKKSQKVGSLKIAGGRSVSPIKIANKQAPSKKLAIPVAKRVAKNTVKIQKAKKIKDVRVKKYA